MKAIKQIIMQPVFRIIILYLLFGGFWIAVSDRILEMLVSDTHRLSALQTYKGWVFVAASALLLYLVARREFRIREKTESALCDTENKYHMLMQSANDGIVITDAGTGTILEVNRKIEELTGLQASLLIGSHITALHPQNDADRCRTLLKETLGSGSAMTGDLCVLHRDGRNIPVEISVSVVTAGGKQIVQASSGMFPSAWPQKRHWSRKKSAPSSTWTLRRCSSASSTATAW
jgi:PAS domain S-box-containing protein